MYSGTHVRGKRVKQLDADWNRGNRLRQLGFTSEKTGDVERKSASSNFQMWRYRFARHWLKERGPNRVRNVKTADAILLSRYFDCENRRKIFGGKRTAQALLWPCCFTEWHVGHGRNGLDRLQ